MMAAPVKDPRAHQRITSLFKARGNEESIRALLRLSDELGRQGKGTQQTVLQNQRTIISISLGSRGWCQHANMKGQEGLSVIVVL